MKVIEQGQIQVEEAVASVLIGFTHLINSLLGSFLTIPPNGITIADGVKSDYLIFMEIDGQLYHTITTKDRS